MPDAASSIRAAYLRQSQAIRAGAWSDVKGIWTTAARDLTDVSMRRFVRETAGVVEAAQTTTANATVSYLDALERTVTGRRSGTFDNSPTGAGSATLRGVEPRALWYRPVARVWRALGQGHGRDRAVQIGQARALELVTTGLQLAHTRTALGWFGSAPVESYRRSLAGPCGMCVLGATQTLAPDEPMPIHPHCGCIVWPRFTGFPAMRPAGEPSAEAARGAVAELTGEAAMTPDAFRRHLAVVEHGEIGPMLRRRGDHFTGPSDISAA